MKKQIIKKEVVEYSKKCPYCDKKVVGSTESQVLFNLEVHINSKHKEVKK